jgi:hypothetical protein
MMERKYTSISNFVPYNAFEVPKKMDQVTWQKLNDKFGQLVQLINTTPFQVAYQLDNITDALTNIINNMGIGKFTILSIGNTDQFTLFDVVIQDIETMAVTRFSRVDFLVESMNPFQIRQVLITPDKQWLSSERVIPNDLLRPDYYRIKNQLHLFSPYATSDDYMRLTTSDNIVFQQTMNEKANELMNMETKDSVPVGTVSSVPSMSLPTADEISKQIVGAGPLHPIGL